MSPSDPLLAAFCDAVASGEYTAAGAVWARYAETVAAAGPAGAASLANMRRLIDWTRRSATASQALATAHIAGIERQSRYAQPSQPSLPTIRILA